MNIKYISYDIEKTVQDEWNKYEVYKSTEKTIKPKFYCVSMLPYPSGKLHIGHIRNYTINDIIYRYYRMNNYNVFMPMGWDAFGMPAENAAINNNMPASHWTYKNINFMKKQMQLMGFSIDWSREITTCNPNYYKWTQLIFLKMFKSGIIYKKNGIVNWDPIDNTVLANEQIINNRGWRSGAIIEKRKVPIYYIRITKYANSLLDDLNKLNWPKNIKKMQKNWIGRSTGLNIKFKYIINGDLKYLKIFTSRIDIIMGVTFCVISTEHKLSKILSKNRPDLLEFIKNNKLTKLEKYSINSLNSDGIQTNIFAFHPITNEKIEIWISNYFLINKTQDIIMGIPAHNKNDFIFAKKYNLPIKQVITNINKKYSIKKWMEWYTFEKKDNNNICISSGKYNGISVLKAIKIIIYDLKKLKLCRKKTIYHLRDWGISRQRYWGTPIPIINCIKCGNVPVPENDLPVLLPENLISNGKENPLIKNKDFLTCRCPKCFKDATREIDTMDTFMDSCWYFLRYPASDATTMIDERTKYWMPIDQYIGGIEHAILHLLYSRFWIKMLYDIGEIKFKEPAKQLLTQGMVLNHTWFKENKLGGKIWYNSSEVTVVYDDNGKIISGTLSDGTSLIYGGIEKMSKSKNNGVNPINLIKKYGSDSLRLYTIFAAPPSQQLVWNESGIKSSNIFICRIWFFAYTNSKKIKIKNNFINYTYSSNNKEIKQKIYLLINQITFDYQRCHYNTVVSGGMKILKILEKSNNINSNLLRELFGIFLKLLYPIIPHVTYYLWEKLLYKKEFGQLLDSTWPKLNEKEFEQDFVNIIFQINGKMREIFNAPKNSSNDIIKDIAVKKDIFIKLSKNKYIENIIFIPNKLINIILK